MSDKKQTKTFKEKVKQVDWPLVGKILGFSAGLGFIGVNIYQYGRFVENYKIGSGMTKMEMDGFIKTNLYLPKDDGSQILMNDHPP